MNTCAAGGYLVSRKHPLPADPTDFHIGSLAVVGCNRLRCAACGALVRNAAGIAFHSRDDQVDLNQVYDTPDLATCPALHQSQSSFRLYVCRCHRWLEVSEHAVDEPDFDYLTDPSVPWRCDGHPLIELPREIDGVRVANQRELEEVASRAFHGSNPPGARPADAEADWVARLHARLTPADADAVASAAAASLEDPDPRVRARVLSFYRNLKLEAGATLVVSYLEGDRRLFAGVPDQVSGIKGETLEDTAWRAVRPLVATPGRARDLARAEVLARGKGSSGLYSTLAAADSG
jgi:hypothetical protein